MSGKRKSNHTRRSRRKKSKKEPAFWVLDTEVPGDLAAKGPFASVRKAEDWIRDDTMQSWQNSCDCLRRGDSPWSPTLLILKEVARVRPDIKWSAKVVLKRNGS